MVNFIVYFIRFKYFNILHVIVDLNIEVFWAIGLIKLNDPVV